MKRVPAPLVSIVTPCLNPGSRLKRCLQSVVDQSYPDIEHIVVDGGSTDGATDLLGRFPGLRWISEPDQGQTDALIKGFGMARGQILTWLNADDSLEPHAVDRVVERFRRHPEVGWVYGKLRTVTDETETIFAPRPSLDLTSFRFQNEIAQPGTFFASWAFEQVGGLDGSFNLTMDVDLWLRLLDAGVPAGYIPEVLATFEIHGGSKSGSLHRGEFPMEEFRAFAKSGRAYGAAICLGVAAAERSVAEDRITRRRLSNETRIAITAGRAIFPPTAPWLVAAQAQAMAATLELRSTPLAVRHLAHPGPWRHPHTRAQAIAVCKGAVLRVLRQPRTKRDG
jgi:GT2 family glycosyltransferase